MIALLLLSLLLMSSSHTSYPHYKHSFYHNHFVGYHITVVNRISSSPLPVTSCPFERTRFSSFQRCRKQHQTSVTRHEWHQPSVTCSVSFCHANVSPPPSLLCRRLISAHLLLKSCTQKKTFNCIQSTFSLCDRAPHHVIHLIHPMRVVPATQKSKPKPRSLPKALTAASACSFLPLSPHAAAFAPNHPLFLNQNCMLHQGLNL